MKREVFERIEPPPASMQAFLVKLGNLFESLTVIKDTSYSNKADIWVMKASWTKPISHALPLRTLELEISGKLDMRCGTKTLWVSDLKSTTPNRGEKVKDPEFLNDDCQVVSYVQTIFPIKAGYI